MDFLTNNLGLFAGGGASAIALWVLKRIPNEDIYDWVEAGARCLGTAVTLGLSKWKFTRNTWASVIEPWAIDLINNTCGAFVNGFIKGLRSDD